MWKPVTVLVSGDDDRVEPWWGIIQIKGYSNTMALVAQDIIQKEIDFWNIIKSNRTRDEYKKSFISDMSNLT